MKYIYFIETDVIRPFIDENHIRQRWSRHEELADELRYLLASIGLLVFPLRLGDRV